MRVGILGSGLMGGKLGTIFAQAGHEDAFALRMKGFKSSRKLTLERTIHLFLMRQLGISAKLNPPGHTGR